MHLGRKISRMRELMGIKQETLAAGLGVSQQAVSKLEQSEKIDDERLEQVAKVLGVRSEAIRNFTEENAVTFISSTFNHSGLFNYNCTLQFNPLEKYLEALETIKELNLKNEKLYEALLKSEKEKVTMLERLLAERNR